MTGTAAVGTKIRCGGNFIADLNSIGGLDLSADTLDTTTLDSTGGYRTFIPGFKDAGEVSISGFFNPSDVGQAAIYNAFESATVNPFSIIFPSGLGATWDFNGVVTAFSTGAELEDLISFEATIKVSGKPTLGMTASAGLTALTLTGTGGALTPAFSNGNYSYAFSGVTSTSVTVTATATNHTIQLFIDNVLSQTLTSGVASAPIPMLAVGAKMLTIVVQEAGKSQKVYEVVVAKVS